MAAEKKNVNIQAGRRLRETRKNMKKSKLEFSTALGVTEEHYRKLEAGTSGLSADKLLLLYENFEIDPTYLITGTCSDAKDFDVEYFAANSSKEQRDEFFDQVLSYVSRMLK